MKYNNAAGFLSEPRLHSIRHSAVSVPHHPTEIAQKYNIHPKKQKSKCKEEKQKWNLVVAPAVAEKPLSSVPWGVCRSCFALTLFSFPLASCLHFLGVFLKEGEGTCLCVCSMFTRVMVAVLSSPPRILGTGPCYFILGQCQLMSAYSITQSWTEASMGEGKQASCEWAECLSSTLPTTAQGIMINTTLETRYNSTLCSSSEKQPDFYSL